MEFMKAAMALFPFSIQHLKRKITQKNKNMVVRLSVTNLGSEQMLQMNMFE